MTYFTLNFYFSRRKKYMNFRSPFSFNDIPISPSLSLVIDLPSTQRHLPSSIHHSNPRRSIIIHTKNSLSPLREKLSSRLLLLLFVEHPLPPPSPPSSTDRASSPRTQWPTVIARAREELEGDGPTKRS